MQLLFMRLLFRQQPRFNPITGLLPALALLILIGIGLEWTESEGGAHTRWPLSSQRYERVAQ